MTDQQGKAVLTQIISRRAINIPTSRQRSAASLKGTRRSARTHCESVRCPRLWPHFNPGRPQILTLRTLPRTRQPPQQRRSPQRGGHVSPLPPPPPLLTQISLPSSVRTWTPVPSRSPTPLDLTPIYRSSRRFDTRLGSSVKRPGNPQRVGPVAVPVDRHAIRLSRNCWKPKSAACPSRPIPLHSQPMSFFPPPRLQHRESNLRFILHAPINSMPSAQTFRYNKQRRGAHACLNPTQPVSAVFLASIG
jgi:hypothetical protein